MRYEDGRFVRIAAPTLLPHNNVLSIFEDAEDDVWVGTQGGLLRLSPGAASTITTADGAPQSINTIYQDPARRTLRGRPQRPSFPGCRSRAGAGAVCRRA